MCLSCGVAKVTEETTVAEAVKEMDRFRFPPLFLVRAFVTRIRLFEERVPPEIKPVDREVLMMTTAKISRECFMYTGPRQPCEGIVSQVSEIH